MTDAKLQSIRKTFNDGQIVAVDGVDLHISEGELVVLVGPSGCGKSTTLRSIAGLEIPDEGRIVFGEQDVTELSPKDRDISMVFQNYALYPSMTVYENMSFGLRMRGNDRETMEEKVRWAAEMMDIGDLLDRYPTELSGGQQQRVALGRAIVRDPSLFLLDEPLSNLDAKLRAVMRTEIQELQRKLGVATVFVTHDQEEAMTMGDRIAVMNNGQVEQIDSPEVIYQDPQSLFVADFIGEPSINLLDLKYEDGRVENEIMEVEIPEEIADCLATELPGSSLVLGVRPENINITPPDEGEFNVEADVIEPIGDRKIVNCSVKDRRLTSLVPSAQRLTEGDTVGVSIDWPETHFFSPSGSKVVKWQNAMGDERTDEEKSMTTDGREH